ncbi:hypothetical protein X842_2030 [Listeria monocytogenes Lm_1880]|nr:hypothetical protein X843_2543 [Listeria monocytogenes Lm_1840]EXL22828.1 hypothetical protein X842_2030 [Listeria monocytogenes Lm_1880]
MIYKEFSWYYKFALECIRLKPLHFSINFVAEMASFNE